MDRGLTGAAIQAIGMDDWGGGGGGKFQLLGWC